MRAVEPIMNRPSFVAARGYSGFFRHVSEKLQVQDF
jgi:hypothetical protein